MWKSLFDSTLDEHASLRTSRKRRPQVPWITEEIQRLIRVRNQQWKKAKRTKDEQAWIEYRMVRNYVTTVLRKSKREYLESVVQQSRKQPKKLWTEISKMLGQCGRPSIRLLWTEEGDLTNCSDMSKAINTFFIERIEHMVACWY